MAGKPDKEVKVTTVITPIINSCHCGSYNTAGFSVLSYKEEFLKHIIRQIVNSKNTDIYLVLENLNILLRFDFIKTLKGDITNDIPPKTITITTNDYSGIIKLFTRSGKPVQSIIWCCSDEQSDISTVTLKIPLHLYKNTDYNGSLLNFFKDLIDCDITDCQYCSINIKMLKSSSPLSNMLDKIISGNQSDASSSAFKIDTESVCEALKHDLMEFQKTFNGILNDKNIPYNKFEDPAYYIDNEIKPLL